MKKRIITILLLITVLFTGISVNNISTYAADGTVIIFLGDSDTPRHHKAIEEGELSEYLSFELNDGAVKSSSFTSGDTSLFKIEKIDGKTYVRGIKEGTGYVTLTVTNDENKTFRERLFISIYKKVEKCTGVLNKSTDGYRGASDNADVEKEDAKGKITSDTKVDIIASCSDYYLIETKDGRLFEDELDTAFLKKKDLDIPTTSISINKEELKLVGNDNFVLNTIVKPSITTDKLVWSSSDNTIASVKDGKITAKNKNGLSTITVKSGEKSKQCIVKVIKMEKPYIEVHNYLDSKNVDLSWKANPYADGYYIYRGARKIYKTINDSNTTKYTFNISKKDDYKYAITYFFVDSKNNKHVAPESDYVDIAPAHTKIVGKSNDKVKIKWNSIFGANGYSIYVATKKGKKYGAFKRKKTVTNKTKNIILGGFKKKHKYKIQVRAYRLINNKKDYFTIGKVHKVKMRNYSKASNYFANRNMIYPSNGVILTKGKMSKKRINRTLINGSNPIVKYNYSTDNNKLYIHTYINIIDKTKGAKFVDYNYKKGKHVRGKTRRKYSKLVDKAIKKYWSVNVKGNKYDFDNGVNFKTKLIIHKKNKNNNKDFKYINFIIGDKKNGKNDSGRYWHFACSSGNSYSFSGEKTIYIATQEMTLKTLFITREAKNLDTIHYGPQCNENKMMAVMGHELGHALGLNDAYRMDNGKRRSIENKEVGYQKAIMYSKDIKANPNDIEMILNAQMKSIKKVDGAFQNYKSFEEKKIKYYISNVIRSKKD